MGIGISVEFIYVLVFFMRPHSLYRVMHVQIHICRGSRIEMAVQCMDIFIVYGSARMTVIVCDVRYMFVHIAVSVTLTSVQCMTVRHRLCNAWFIVFGRVLSWVRQ